MLVHFFAMVLTITSSIATMTTDLDPATWQDAAAAGGNTRPQLRLTPGASSETDAFKLLPRPGSDTIGVASSSLSLEHQRNASSSSAASGDAQDKGTWLRDQVYSHIPMHCLSLSPSLALVSIHVMHGS